MRGADTDMISYGQKTCLLQTFTGRFVKSTELLPCVKAKCISETEISKLVMTLLVGKFWATLPIFQNLRRVIFIFFATSNII